MSQISLDIDQLAHWMDSVFEIPGLKLRFGLDAIIGLIPGIGDLLTSFVSFYILHQASQSGVSRITLARMGLNLAVDYIIGSIPLVGDLFDVYWKANERNAALLRRHALADSVESRRLHRGDGWFVTAMILLLLLLLVGSIFLAVTVVVWIASALWNLIT